MTLIKRLHRLARLPRYFVQLSKLMRAWGRNDWPRMISLLQRIADAGFESNSDHVLRGLAYSRQGLIEDALQSFERVTRGDLLPVERPWYFSEYAYLLARIGRVEEARELILSAPRDLWSRSQRRWAEKFLVSHRPRPAPPVEWLKRRVIH